MKVILLSLLLFFSAGAVSAAPSEQQQVPKPVIAQVEEQTGGRVLDAQVTEQGYRLKVLLPGGRVKIVEVGRGQ